MILALVALLVMQAATPEKPEALRNFERARSELRTGRITCVVTGGPHIVGMPVVQYTMEMAKSGELLYSYDGDLEGVWGRDEFGYPMLVGRTQVLVERDVAWCKSTFDLSGLVAPRATWRRRSLPGVYPGEKVDLRAIGMVPDWDSLAGENAGSVLSNTLKDCSGYSVKQEGSIHHVTVHYPDERVMVYEIDEAQGWNATRISGYRAGREWECVIDLRERDGIWFPETTTVYVDGVPRTECVITHASFNSPGDPAGWGPADIGFEVGTFVSFLGQPPGGKGNVWDGQRAVPYEEFRKLVESGKVKLGPTQILMRAGNYEQPGMDVVQRLRSSPGVLEAFMGAWEFYVITFCERHRLNAEQTQKAYRCLRQAQERGYQYMSRNRERFQHLQKKRDSGKLSPEQVQEEFLKLRKPIDDIFENQLKPCLEKIPTPKQRKEAERRKKERHEKLEVRPPAPVKSGQP